MYLPIRVTKGQPEKYKTFSQNSEIYIPNLINKRS